MVNLKPFFTCSSHALMPLPYGSTHPCALDPHVFLDKMLRIHGLQYVPSYKVIQMDPFSYKWLVSSWAYMEGL